MTAWRAKWLAALCGLGLWATSNQCLAWPEYPPVVRQTFGLRGAPDCILCHINDLGGQGTATKPFARTLQQLGLGTELDPTLLATLLQQVDDCKIDSDGDGIPDVTEIKSQGDPNDGHGPATSQCGDVYNGPLPETGCSLANASLPSWFPWLLVGACASSALVRKRRRARRPAVLR